MDAYWNALQQAQEKDEYRSAANVLKAHFRCDCATTLL